MSDMADKSALLKDLASRFRALRKELRWTQERLSRQAHVSRDTVHRLEHGQVIDASSLALLLDALGYRLSFEKRPALRAADMRRLFPDVHEDPQ